MRREAAVQSWSTCTRSSRSSVITSNDANRSRSCTGVTIPAWCAPSNGTGASTAERIAASAVPSSATSDAMEAAPTSEAMVAVPAAPAVPRNARRLTGFGVTTASRPDHLLRHLGERLGQRVDHLRECLGVVLREVGVRHVGGGAGLVRLQRGVHRRELGVELRDQLRALLLEDRLHRVVRRFGALHVGLEVDEVGARVALLLTRDLRLRHLVEQFDRAVGDAGGLELDVLHEVLERGDVLVELLRGVGESLRGAVDPELLLDVVVPTPVLLGDVTLASVDLGVEVTERLGHRLDALVRDARRRVQLLRLLE